MVDSEFFPVGLGSGHLLGLLGAELCPLLYTVHGLKSSCQNMTEFGDTAFKEVIDVKQDRMAGP